MKKVIFVCLGNICRSPICEGIFNAMVEQNALEIEVDSAGVAGYHIDERPHHLSIKVAKNHGIDISKYVGRKINLYDDLKADMILALDKSVYHELKALGFSQTKMLGEYGLNGASIPDPYGKDETAFEEVYGMCEKACENLLKDLK